MKKLFSILLALVFVIGMFGTGFVAAQEEDTQSSIDSLLIRGKCTTLIVGKDATLDSSVFLAHNEDLGGPSTQHLIVVPRIQHEPGDEFELYSGGSIPQPEETYAYIASTIFDMDYIPGTITTGINEYQVSIANNYAPSREELVPEDEYELKEGGVIWTEFQQIALERAKTAREAVEIMGQLSEDCWLSGDPGTAFGIADPNEGWFIEIPREGQWVAKRVPDDGYAMMANCFRIGEIDFDDNENFMWSENVVNFAVERGWYDPASGEPFNFAETYGDPARAERPSNIRRHWRVESLLAEFVPEVTVEDVISIMRDHYEGTEYDLTNGYEVSPHHTQERSICRTSTEVCIVAQLRNWLPAEIGGVAWWALSAPCSSVFVPWYMGILEVPYEYTIGTDVEDDESAFWAFNRLEGLVDAHYGDLIGDVREAWAAFEAKELKLQPVVEKVALKAYYKDSERARQFLTRYSNGLGMKAINMAHKMADKLERDLLREVMPLKQ